MRRRITVIVLFAALLIMALLILLQNRAPFGKSNSEFSAKPKHEITKIEFSENRDKLILEKKGEEWLVNGKSKARKGGINFITMILKDAKIKSPVSPELFEKEIEAKNISPVNVRVYEGRKLIRSLKVYKTSSNSYGNIMKIKERSKPFIVYVPGYEANIGSAFTLNEHYWKPYTIFNFLPSEINSVRFENPADTSSSFIISKKEGSYSLSGNKGELSTWNASLIIRYLSYFTFIPFESWAQGMSVQEKASLDKLNPLYRITIVSSEGYTVVLSLWEKKNNEIGKGSVDSDRLYGKIQGNDDFFVVRYFDIDPIVKKRSYFFSD